MARYLRASKWKLDEARKRIKATIEWRREFQPELIPPDEVKIEAATGKMWVHFPTIPSQRSSHPFGTRADVCAQLRREHPF